MLMDKHNIFFIAKMTVGDWFVFAALFICAADLKHGFHIFPFKSDVCIATCFSSPGEGSLWIQSDIHSF